MRSVFQQFLKKSRGPIGIDVGATAIRFAQTSADFAQLQAVASVDLAPGATPKDWTAAFRENLETGRFRGREAVLSLPASWVQTCHLRLPRLTDAELSQAVAAEAASQLSLAPGAAVVRHIVAGEIQSKLEVIVMAAPRSQIDELLRAASRARLDVVGLNIGTKATLACYSHLHRRTSDREGVHMLIDLGHGGTRVIIYSGTQIFFARTLDIGNAALAESHADNAANRKQLLSDLRLCRGYHESNFPSKTVSHVLFSGGGGLEPSLWQQLSTGLTLPAQVGDPLARIPLAEEVDFSETLDRRAPQPQWSTAIGLALSNVSLAKVA